MPFHYDRSRLCCDGTALDAISAATGTPAYVYSARAVERNYRALDRAFAGYPHRLHYALKANSTLAIARLLHGLGSAVDANSVGEIEVALRAGFGPNDIVFSGVGKRDDELDRAVALGVRAINIESAGEAERLEALAQARDARPRIALRINPDVDAGSHPHITTGLSASKFGMPAETARGLARRLGAGSRLELVGLHVHIGSQIRMRGPVAAAARALAALTNDLREAGIALEHLDMGGGLGVAYEEGGCAMSASEYAEAILPAIRPTGATLLLEPGRAIVASAGVLLARVVDIKPRAGGGRFAVLDAGMTELIRPAFYGAYHRIQPLTPRAGEKQMYEVVGPLCETSDSYGQPRLLSPLEVGDAVAVLDAGGYGSVMASNYNRRTLAPEVLVEDATWRLIRRRQTFDELLALEV